MDNESNLLKKATEGDIYAFEQLILGYEKMVYSIAYRMLPNSEDAKDISQEVLIKIYKNLHEFSNIKYFKAWIAKITTNTCIDELRKRRRKEIISLDEKKDSSEGEKIIQIRSTETTPEESVVENEERVDLIAAIHKLPDDYKTLIILRDIQGLSYNEIADVTNSNLGTVKSRLSRARRRLKLLYEKEQSQQKNVNIKYTSPDERR